MFIVIDPGHGGKDSGAVGPRGLLEKSINLKVGKMLARAFASKGFVTDLTRIDDFYVGLSARGKWANNKKANLFISLHCNAATTNQAHGIEIWTTKGKTESDVVAEYIYRAIAKTFSAERFRADLSDGDHDKEANYTVITTALCPAILIEMGFISHPESEIKLGSEAYQKQMVEAIVNGVLNYRNSCL